MIPACNMTHEVWGPNDGCREFMAEPDAIIECGQPAIGVQVIREFYPPDLTNPHDEGLAVQVIWYCLDCERPTSATPYCDILFDSNY